MTLVELAPMPKSLLCIENLSVEQQIALLDRAEEMRHEPKRFRACLDDRIVALMFLEPSTRTALTFQAAVSKLGGSFISSHEMSLKKGESFSDTIRFVNSIVDVIVIRSESNDTKELEKLSDIPLINAGNGSSGHPTQALLDLYNIRRRCHRLNGLRVGIGFDPLHSRTIKTLLMALSMHDDNTAVVVAPSGFQLGEADAELYRQNGLKVELSDRVSDLYSCEIIYANRFQTERLDAAQLKRVDEKLRHEYRVRYDDLVRSDVKLVLDPLPRVGEIEDQVDQVQSVAGYFDAAANGVWLRMALLDAVVNDWPVS